MATSYDDAVAALHRAPHGDFVAERKRLAGELKAAGDKTAAARLAKLPRPPISAWAVNQLWWQEREAFEALFSTAATVRQGELRAMTEHRDVLTALRDRAREILIAAGNSAAEPTLRRLGTTLAALAATGGFDPDPPGALGEDRDPPGFEALGALGSAPARGEAPERADGGDGEERQREADAAAEARRREKVQRERGVAVRAAERALASAKTERDAKRLEIERLQKALAAAETALARAEARVPELEEELAEKERSLAEAAKA